MVPLLNRGGMMKGFVQGADRQQTTLLPECLDDWVDESNPVLAPVTDQSCAATSSANTLIGVGCPHAPPSCANLHSARRSRRHRLPFPAGSFIEGFRTPATVQAASLRSAGIRNPQQYATSQAWPDME